MQSDSGKQDADDLEDKLKELGSTTKGRLDAAIDNPEVAKEMAKSAAQQRIDELKAIAREPPKPRAQVLLLPVLSSSTPPHGARSRSRASSGGSRTPASG